jgi:short subunit dehydrogenase-like uncharacterized protein
MEGRSVDWVIYGANGYTGRLAAEEAVRRGMTPVLAGRSEAAIRPLAQVLGLECRVFQLDNSAKVAAAISGFGLVLHCAGPFSVTSEPMVRACLDAGVHYLDITGEISVFEFAHSLDDEARHADVVLIPGTGFDVVPSDCLAASLVRELPAATRMQLAFEASGGPSPGTAKTSVEGLGKGGCVRKDGQLIQVPLGWKSREIPFAHGKRQAVTIPWGDVFTAYISTGVPDIEVYMSVPPASIRGLKRLRWVQPLLGLNPVQSFLKTRAEAKYSGPSEERRTGSGSELWGEVRSADGRTASATMSTPNGYDLTVSASLGIVEHLLEHQAEGGYYTPSLLMGADYASTLPGVTFNRLS